MSPNVKQFRIICLKRSSFERTDDFMWSSEWYEKSHIVYWKSERSGYTQEKDEAGLYSLLDIQFINGKFLDWLIEPAWEDYK